MVHPMRLATPGHPEAINLLTIHLHTSGLVVGPRGMAMLGVGSAVVLGIVGPRNHNHRHRTMERTLVLGREIGHMGTLEECRNTPILSDDSDSEPAR